MDDAKKTSIPAVGRLDTTPHYRHSSPVKKKQTCISDKVYEAIEKLISEGLPLDPIIRSVGLEGGVDDERWVKWTTMFPSHYRKLQKLAAEAELEDVRRIRSGAKSWQSLGWCRERLQTELYGQRQKSGKVGGKRGSAILDVIGGRGKK